MTSLRPLKEPSIVKLDRRYKGYNRGFRYRVDFNTQGMEKWHDWMQIVKWCENTWGKEYTWSDDGFLPRQVRSEEHTSELQSH